MIYIPVLCVGSGMVLLLFIMTCGYRIKSPMMLFTIEPGGSSSSKGSKATKMLKEKALKALKERLTDGAKTNFEEPNGLLYFFFLNWHVGSICEAQSNLMFKQR
jgi:hypothetical protein